ncbi:hypothetical protein HUS23_08910 [Ectothiorhodospiraceae bacterium 2226]|nr:hypothetical protein HUS23_08910 [Ectothiorhodospiraceae bacterium 2226]
MKRMAAGLALALLMGGCAGPEPEPTVADEMRARAGIASDFAEQWEAARVLVGEGEAQMAHGEQQLKEAREARAAAERLEREGNQNVADGRNKLAHGQAEMERVEREYKQSLPQSLTAP